MGRTRRGAIDELAGYDQLGLDGATAPQDDFFQFGDGPGALTVWGTGLISFGPATAAQQAFMANLAVTTDLSLFPGDCVAIGFSASQYAIIEYWTGGFWISTPVADAVIDQDGVTVRGTGSASQQVGWSLGGQDFVAGAETTYWSDLTIIEGSGASESLTVSGLAHGPYGSTAETLRGLGGDDLLIGGAGGDALDGGAGNDRLVGNGGNDRLWGGDGNDRLEPGLDFTTNYAGPQETGFISIDGGAGFDTLVLDYSADPRSLAFVADRMLSGAITNVEAVDVTGTPFADTITGTAFADRLAGGAGDDVLRGGAGNDILDAGAPGPSVTGLNPRGGATLADAVSLDYLFAPAGSGVSTLSINVRAPSTFLQSEGLQQGGVEYFAFTVTQPGAALFIDYEVEEFSESPDFTIVGLDKSLPYDPAVPFIFPEAGVYYLYVASADTNFWDSAGINLTLTIEGALDAAGNRLIGGTGNDTYYVYSPTDLVIENAGEGTDTVVSTVDFALGTTVENLTLAGSTAIEGAGNGLANRITGNSADNLLFGKGGNDTLNGRGGADIMRGGTGDDIYVVDDAGDRVQEGAGAGYDRVDSAIGITLASNVEKLVLTGTDSIRGTGNDLDNLIYGNSGANLIDGRGGADIMRGGAGDDVYTVDNVGDRAVESSGAGYDRVNSSVSFTLGAGVEKLVLTGTAAITGKGNASDNALYGNSASNILMGFDGNDSFSGGAGDDRLYGGDGNDRLTGGSGIDRFYFQTALDASANVDRITDFSLADDWIVLDRSIFGTLAKGALSANAFHAGTAAADAGDHIIYDSASGRIYYDADGAGGDAQVLFAQVTAGLALSNSDFVISG